LETGEAVTAEALLENVEGSEVYFPVRDVGVDLLVVRGSKHVGVQVKESRYYLSAGGEAGHSWHQLSVKNLRQKGPDFYVFLTYVPRFGERRVRAFENRFVIVPAADLDKLVAGKSSGKKSVYSFYLSFEGDKVTETRDEPADYSLYLDRWDLIGKALQ
jgi:hypothetical protein